MNFIDSLEKIGKRELIAVILILIVIFSVSAFMITNTDDEEERERKPVIKGGVIGGPVKVGRTRIKVVGDEKTEEWVEIKDGEIEPSETNISKNSDVYFQNLDRNQYTINFLGQRKRAYLAFNQSYLLTFNSQGMFRYRVYNDSWETEGKVVVSA